MCKLLAVGMGSGHLVRQHLTLLQGPRIRSPDIMEFEESVNGSLAVDVGGSVFIRLLSHQPY